MKVSLIAIQNIANSYPLLQYFTAFMTLTNGSQVFALYPLEIQGRGP